MIWRTRKIFFALQEVVEAVEALPQDDQLLLIEIIRRRLIQHRRAELAAEVAEARRAYQKARYCLTLFEDKTGTGERWVYGRQ
ncbi:MAG: hypothetical protein HPY58_10255 [Firmicutes bacterium]|nr:hypothetical protein [Bacillota bacterium]